MMFVDKGQPIRGESHSEIDLKSSPQQASGRDCMFEVQYFTLKTGLDPTMPDTKAMKTAMKQAKKGIVDAPKDHGIATEGRHRARPNRRFGAARTFPAARITRNGVTAAKWNIRSTWIRSRSPGRSTERSSDLLTNCIERGPFSDRATMIKRQPDRGPTGRRSFLRIDFTKVLMINVAWCRRPADQGDLQVRSAGP